MATNWVKDGLDSYLALTGENRAEKRADAELAAQRQGMDLTQKQDARAAESADLNNQKARLDINESTRRASEVKRTDSAILDLITMKTASDTSIPNSLDPAAIAASRQTAADLAHTASLLNNIPPGASELNMASLPPAAQKVLMEGPGKAALLRKGIVHKDAASGVSYTMTGEMGPVRIVRDEGQPARVIPTMLAQKDDGTLIEVPYTENKSNDPSDPVKFVTADMLSHRAGATLAALDMAEKAQISPAVAYSQNIYKLVQALPYEQRVAWLQTEIQKETGRRDKYVTDEKTAKDAEPFAQQINALTGTPEEKRTAATAIMLGAPSAVVDHLLKTSKSVHDLFPDIKAKSDYKSRTRQEGLKEVFEESQDGGQTWKAVSSGPKFNPKPTGNGEDLRSKRDIAVRLRDAQRGYQTAMKTGDPDTINEAIGFIESLNDDARTYGVTPMPGPERHFTSTENETIKFQAIKNLKEQRQGVAKFFGTEPNLGAIRDEIKRIKQTVKPGNVSFGGPQAQPTGGSSTMPPAAQHSGRIIKDTVTGKRFQSNGSGWQEIR